MFLQFLLYSEVTQPLCAYVYIYMYTHSFFSYYLPSCSNPRDWLQFLCAVQQDLITHPFFFLIFFFVFLPFLGLLPWHMEVPRLGVQSELQPPAYATGTATRDPSCICNLHHSSRQCWILNPLSKARDRTHNLVVPSRIHFHCATTGTPVIVIFIRGSLTHLAMQATVVL